MTRSVPPRLGVLSARSWAPAVLQAAPDAAMASARRMPVALRRGRLGRPPSRIVVLSVRVRTGEPVRQPLYAASDGKV